MMRRIMRPAIALVVAAILIHPYLDPTRALAIGTQNCQEGPGKVNHWRGNGLTAGQKHGVSGTVRAFTFQLCTGPGFPVEIDGSFYFSNLIPAGGGVNDIIQVGFGQARVPTLGGGMQYIVGYGRTHTTPGCSGAQDKAPLALSKGTYVFAQHDYKVYHQNNLWRYFVDNTQVYSTTEAAICWTPATALWFDETWDAGDQLGGTQAVHLTVQTTNYANAENGGFFLTNFNAAQACNWQNGVAPAAYQCDIIDTDAITMWTKDR